jgi:hypothetical protein
MKTFAKGAEVILRTIGNCSGLHGSVIRGTVIRQDGDGKVVVLWNNTGDWTRHWPENLILADCAPDARSRIHNRTPTSRHAAAAAHEGAKR